MIGLTVFLLFFALTFLNLFAILHLERNPLKSKDWDWRVSFLASATLMGILVVLSAEGLSLLNLISADWVRGFWVVLSILTTAFALRWRSYDPLLNRFREGWAVQERVHILLLSGILLIFALTLSVAFVSTPNTTDSLRYHMTRVVHWIQNGDLDHFPTGYEPQVVYPYGSELGILHLMLLGGTEQLANLVQWLSMVGSVILSSLLAKELCADRRGQWAAAAFTASLPVGILQSTSTQNDYVTGFWLLGTAVWVLKDQKRRLSRLELALLGAALGIGMLTKGTFYPYALPFVVWFGLSRIWRKPLIQALAAGGLVSLPALVLNVGFWTRNIITYGGPLGPPRWVHHHTQFSFSPGLLLTSIAQDLLLNFVTPFEGFNQWLVQALEGFHQLMGQEMVEYPFFWSWNHEDLAGNPLHFLLIVAGLVVLILLRRKAGRWVLLYGAASLIAFAAVSWVVTFDPFGVRYQLPFFLLGAPLVGVAAGLLPWKKGWVYLSICLVILSTPWLLFNRSRPMIGLRPRTMIESIYKEPQRDVLFANWILMRDDHEEIANRILGSGCSQVGLRLDSQDFEYFTWWLLDAPWSGIRIENLDPYIELIRYVDPSFEPCAIVCTVCGQREQFHGLQRVMSRGQLLLFMGSNYETEEDG